VRPGGEREEARLAPPCPCEDPILSTGAKLSRGLITRKGPTSSHFGLEVSRWILEGHSIQTPAQRRTNKPAGENQKGLEPRLLLYACPSLGSWPAFPAHHTQLFSAVLRLGVQLSILAGWGSSTGISMDGRRGHVWKGGEGRSALWALPGWREGRLPTSREGFTQPDCQLYSGGGWSELKMNKEKEPRPQAGHRVGRN
jgi:hypothetical protein